MKEILIFIFGIAIGICIMSLIPSAGDGHHTVIYETVVDTVEFYKPVPRDSVVVRYKTIILPTEATLNNDTLPHDSAEVVIPITQKIYQDSTYKAYVSGYDVALDSISVYSKTVTIRETSVMPSPRVSVGLIGGVGCGRQGLSPFIGIGVSYRLWNIK